MVALRRQSETKPQAEATPPRRVFLAPTADARALMARVRAFTEAEPDPPARWSRRRTLAFVVAASAVAWGGLLAFGIGFARIL